MFIFPEDRATLGSDPSAEMNAIRMEAGLFFARSSFLLHPYGLKALNLGGLGAEPPVLLSIQFSLMFCFAFFNR